MEVLYRRCAGLDVHAGSVTACVRIAVDATVTYEHRTVSANTRGLLDLGNWLSAHGCTHVAMEATGVYWKNHEGVPSPTPDVSGSVWPCIWARS
jgi:transposase